MWCRMPRLWTFVLFAGCTFALLLVVWYNEDWDYGHASLDHFEVLNIQQKVLKHRLQANDETRQNGGLVFEANKSVSKQERTEDSYSASSSNFSDDDLIEQASDLTGDNAGEVRVSSSVGKEPDGSDDDGDDDDVGGNNGPDVEWRKAERGRPRETGHRDRLPMEHRTQKENTALNDAYWDSDEVDVERTSRGKKSQFLQNWDEYDPNGWQKLHMLGSVREAEAQRGEAVVYNRVGKCGSRSVITVMRELALKNKFHFVSSLVYNKTRISPVHEGMLVNVVGRLERPFIFQRHLHFVDFRRYQMQQPKYINIIRDPLSRMVSQYYFRRFGDGKSERKYSGTDKYQTFDECVLRGKTECLGKKSFYIIPFFCGQDPRCKDPTEWSLEKAVRNFNERYVAVGLLEELDNTFRVFEKVLPQLFAGAMDIYTKTVSGELRGNITRMFTKHKVKPSPRVAAIMQRNMRLEYKFYNMVRRRFQEQKRMLGIK
ncbi:uronyl 2-sulfotransferase-like [Diadema antillarum]|uniref:uronyl 2-sulfotransferase-like n=1 Tax=Diadema antillarum TaxID=105358 RepID=UPI003A8441BC